MTWNDVLIKFIEVVCGIIVSVAVPILVNKLKSKIQNEQVNLLIDRAANLVCQCVMATNQTYVDSLKKSGSFTKEDQALAFEKTKAAVVMLLDSEAKNAIVDTFGDLETWIDTAIESNVRECKAYD